MSHLRTSAFWILVILALGTGVYAYFSLKKNKKPPLDAISVLPDKCLVYLNTRDFSGLNKKINSQSLIVDKLKLYGDINAFCNTLHAFDSLFNTNEELQEAIRDNTLHFALYAEKQGWISAFNIKRSGRQDDIAEHLSQVLSAVKSKADIYAFKIQGFPLYFNLSEGVTTISNRQELIIHSLNKKTPKLQNNAAFLQFKNTLSENGLLAIYTDHSLYSESKAASRLNLSYACKKGYSAGTIDLQPSQLKINGYIQPGEEETISFFSDQKAQSTRGALTELPAGTRFFKAFGFSAYPDLRLSFPLTNVHIKYWIKANERGLYNVEDDFNENLVSHILEFETQSQKFISVAVDDTVKAAEHLKFMSDSILKQDDYTIYRLNDSIEKPLQLFIPLSLTSTNYALLYHSHIFFADQSEQLPRLINDLKTGNVLLNHESFNSYSSQHFPEEFNYLIYGSPNQMPQEVTSFFDFKQELKENPFENFKHVSFSVWGQDNLFKFRFHLMNETDAHTKQQNVLWTLNLDTTCSMPASGFVNHISRENEIVLQDDANTLYLINAKGTVLWKKKLNEKILSPIHSVDIYKKDKYQLLFNTKSQLHLIDRNGNYVESYPVKLPAEASSEMSLFDYEGDKDYRIFIACKNNSIYNYNIHGVPQEKFATVKTESEVNLPVQFVKAGQSDYLVALDREGKIYIFSRKGAGRIGLRNRTNINCSVFYADAGNSISSTYLVYVDEKNGLINKISFEDKKEIVKLHSETQNASVAFHLVDDNRSMDLVITQGNTFQAYNFSGNLILEKELDVALSKTNYYGDESHSVFYALSADKTTLIVFDQLKSQIKTFRASALPLISNLFNDNKKFMLLTNGRQLNCVPLN